MRTYSQNRDKIAEYFNKTGFRAWEALTNETPVSKIRLKVRQSREKMRRKILSILPNDLSGKRVLDAGCGPGQFSIELAQRGASVLGIDISSNLIEIAKKRLRLTKTLENAVVKMAKSRKDLPGAIAENQSKI